VTIYALRLNYGVEDRRVAAGLGPTLTFREFLAAKALAREGG